MSCSYSEICFCQILENSLGMIKQLLSTYKIILSVLEKDLVFEHPSVRQTENICFLFFFLRILIFVGLL